MAMKYHSITYPWAGAARQEPLDDLHPSRSRIPRSQQGAAPRAGAVTLSSIFGLRLLSGPGTPRAQAQSRKAAGKHRQLETRAQRAFQRLPLIPLQLGWLLRTRVLPSAA